MPVGMLFIMKTFEDEWYVVIKAHKFMVFEILRDFLYYHIYCVSALSLHLESTNSTMSEHLCFELSEFFIPVTQSCSLWSSISLPFDPL